MANPRIKRVRRLRKRSQRDRDGLILVEGHRAVRPALDAGAVTQILCTAGAAASPTVERARAEGIPIAEVTHEVMGRLTAAASAPGVLAVAKMPSARTPEPPALVLASVRDPATEGALIGLAAAAGCRSVVLTDGCADPYDPKVLRAAGAAHFVVRVVPRPGSWREALDPLGSTVAVPILLAATGPAPWEVAMPSSPAFILGPEDVDDAGEMLRVAVPAPGGPTPSLSVRSAVVLYEWVRQMGRTT